ncbi:MAG: DEAD/DEAH box helicase family protein [Magnetococcales bacterium]|nr:DEAD/DEAH box helicase family protein [Magnetococcales bacterium]
MHQQTLPFLELEEIPKTENVKEAVQPTASGSGKPEKAPEDARAWAEILLDAFDSRKADPLKLAEQALKAHPTDGEILHLVSLAALLEEKPDACLRYQKRMAKRFVPNERDHLLLAIAAAQKNRWTGAIHIALKEDLYDWMPSTFYHHRPYLGRWVANWLKKFERRQWPDPQKRWGVKRKPGAGPVRKTPSRQTASSNVESSPPKANGLEPAPDCVTELSCLPRFDVNIPIRFSWPEEETISFPGIDDYEESVIWFQLREELAQLGLLQDFNELLCLPFLRQVDTYWYQVETVRKVLRQFRGRVLLADEVGLGKTIEAGMAIKEYLLRGMAERILILTPASLVGQWQEEMASKFDVAFSTSYDPLLRKDPQEFWSQKLVIASIAAARREPHFSILAKINFDLVIVDEAHHLKNRTTQNWKLVDSLRKRFLILLSATPVQNNLLELYNLLTLLKPGIFKTEKEFRSAYVTPRKPRVPINRQQLRDLMREVMVRNTRSLVDVRLPPRQAITVRLDTAGEELACYEALTALVREALVGGETHHRLGLHTLLTAAGSSPAAAAGATGRFAARLPEDERWQQIHDRYQALTGGAKETALLDLLRRNATEKKMVFVHHRDTLARLDWALREQKIDFACFEGGMSGPAKDAAIADFRDRVPVLLCTESGGEGRNVQFCNTLINFDLPWNPMIIEQRIGRIHRIGQTREVFVFNLAIRGTAEDQVLKILDEKINMFELVVGEVDAILGELEDQREFAEMVFAAWVETTDQGRISAFTALGERMAAAKGRYEEVKSLDNHLFGQEFEIG